MSNFIKQSQNNHKAFMKGLKRGGLVLILFAFGALTSCAKGESQNQKPHQSDSSSVQETGWSNWLSKEHGFQVSFPKTPPVITNQEGSVLKGTLYESSDKHGDFCAVGVFEYNYFFDDVNSKKALESAIKGRARSIREADISIEFGDFHGNPSANSVIQGYIENKKVYSSSFLVLTKNKLNKLTLYSVMHLSENEDKSSFNKMRNSFTLTQP